MNETKRHLQCCPGRRSADAFDFCAGQGREQEKWIKNHIVFIQLWEMVSWQRVLCGKALWLAININSIIYAQLLIGIIFKFLEIQRMLWDMKSFQSVLVHLAGM